MKIFVQNSSTGKFLQKNGRWTAKADEALEFKSSAAAVAFCVENELDNVQIVLRFGDARYDAKLPLRNSGNGLRPQ